MLQFLIFFFLAAFCCAWAQGGPALKIDTVSDTKTIYASGVAQDIRRGQVLAIRSQSADVGLIGYTRVLSVEKAELLSEGNLRVKVEVIRLSQYNIVRVGDHLVSFDLTTESDGYFGSTELLVRQEAPGVSARFRPLFTQGIAIGETAQTLTEGETLITWYGLFYYGVTEWMSIGTLVPGDVFGNPNLSAKVRFIDSQSDSVSSGLTFTKIRDTNRYTVNWNVMWDSFNKENSLSHTFATLAIYSIERAEETTAIKSAGTSSIQTGYELIMSDWSRVLFGPNYNVETKSVGGYLAYVSIWDHFHLQGSLYSTNIRNVNWSVKDGYFAYIDAYWRF